MNTKDEKSAVKELEAKLTFEFKQPGNLLIKTSWRLSGFFRRL